jgi:hypothetical protein
MRGVAKRDLPSKTCAHCGRPFSWRRRWARDWEQVKYCSDACRRGRPAGVARSTATPGGAPMQARLDFAGESGDDGDP